MSLGNIKKMADVDLRDKRVLIREDLNVPIKDGKITNDARLVAALPTIKLALQQGAKVMVMSHWGRPVEGFFSANFTLQAVAEYLSHELGRNVPLVKNYLDAPVDVKAGSVVLLENVRFNKGERNNDEALAKKYAALCDVFVMDAFGTAHRAQASTHGVAKYAPTVCAGPLMAAELEALGTALLKPAHPMIAIVGGAKVSTKLDLLTSLANICDQLIVGGGMANTFIAAAGFNIGKSLCEPDLIATAEKIAAKVKIPLPVDVVVTDASFMKDDFMGYISNSFPQVKDVTDVGDNDMILDIGPETAKEFAASLRLSKTILWNGPMGVFEVDAYAKGTEALARAIAESHAFSIAGGGDTLAAIDKYKIADKISYISTGGGAFLEFVEGKVLPTVAVLEERSKA